MRLGPEDFLAWKPVWFLWLAATKKDLDSPISTRDFCHFCRTLEIDKNQLLSNTLVYPLLVPSGSELNGPFLSQRGSNVWVNNLSMHLYIQLPFCEFKLEILWMFFPQSSIILQFQNWIIANPHGYERSSLLTFSWTPLRIINFPWALTFLLILPCRYNPTLNLMHKCSLLLLLCSS